MYPARTIVPTVGKLIPLLPKANESDVRDALPLPNPATYVTVKTSGAH